MSLLLVAAEGYSYQEAAEILDLPLGTVASQVARARLALSRRFNESERGLPPASPAGSE